MDPLTDLVKDVYGSPREVVSTTTFPDEKNYQKYVKFVDVGNLSFDMRQFELNFNRS